MSALTTLWQQILHCIRKWVMSKSFDVCIRGDGVVGRTLALQLARERLLEVTQAEAFAPIYVRLASQPQ